MIALHTEWLQAAGDKVLAGTPVEIGPLFALEAGDLRGKIAAGQTIERPTFFSGQV